MLYLFGQLALSDSLFYHEDFAGDDCPAYLRGANTLVATGANARTVATGRRLRRGRHLSQAGRTTASPRG